MARLIADLDLGLVLDSLYKVGRRLIILKTFRRENDLVNILLLIHLVKPLIVNRELVDWGREAYDQTVDLCATVRQLFNQFAKDDPVAEPGREQVTCV